MLQKIIKENLLIISIVVAGVLIAGAVVYTNYANNTISSQEAGEKLVGFVNKNL